MKISYGLLLLTFFFPAFAVFPQSPRWLANKDAVFPPSSYITGRGEGKTTVEARDRALMQISMYFNTSIHAQSDLLSTYQQTNKDGKITFTEETSLSESALINTRADFFGVIFEAPYTDQTGTVYVLAKINRAEALAVYDSRIQNALAQANDLLAKNETGEDPYASFKKLKAARALADLAGEYASMAVLIDSASASRYTSIRTLKPSIANAIEENKKRMTLTVTLNESRVNTLVLAAARILGEEGFIIVDSGGLYETVLSISLNENQTRNYHTVAPLVDISFGLRNKQPLARFKKEYPVYRHTSLNDVIGRALRNIEQDFKEEFINQLRRIEE